MYLIIVDFILNLLKKASLLGHTYLMRDEMEDQLCGTYDLTEKEAIDLLDRSIAEGTVVSSEKRIYLPTVDYAEEAVADFVSDALSRLPEAVPPLNPTLSLGSVTLNSDQRRAVQVALGHRLSMVVGSAGTGKSMIVRAIVECSGNPDACLLLAPTGKATQNLAESTGVSASTIHSALGIPINGDLTHPNRYLRQFRVVVVDEASMLTVEMMAGIANAVSDSCKIVLVGDSQQLPPVGCGNLLTDFRDLGVPYVTLKTVYRQSDKESALFYNITHFRSMRNSDMLRGDNSFVYIPSKEAEIAGLVLEMASRWYRASHSTAILSPFGEKTDLSVEHLNHSMQMELRKPETPCLDTGSAILYEHDRVMFTQNNKAEGYFNGQMGEMVVSYNEWGNCVWSVCLSSGIHVPVAEENQRQIVPAYALTIHKAQGSAFDTVILPLSMQFSVMMTRNLLYTALTRARKQVILIGDLTAIDYALARPTPERNSTLMERVQQRMPALAS